jgi:hypothetical protein
MRGKNVSKTTLALTIILALLCSTVSGAMFTRLASANPAPLFPFPHDSPPTSPSIVVYSPVQNEIYHSAKLLLNFSLIKPNDWFPSGDYEGDHIVFGNVTSVYYIVDDSKPQNIAVHDVDNIIGVVPPRTLSFCTTLNLTAGVHSVEIGLCADTYWVPDGNWNISTVAVQENSDPVNFTVAIPQPVILSPENIAYVENSVPLVFTLGTSATSWVGYSLNGTDNVTLAGNTTLTGLSNGKYNITVYANDTFGNVGLSQIVNFIVAKPEPFPTVPVAVASGASIAAVAAGILLWKKRKREVEPT